MTLGLRDLYYALITITDGVETYGTPVKMAEVISCDLSVTTAEGTLYADDAVSESVKQFTKGTIKLGVKDLEPTVLAAVLGQTVDTNQVVWAGADDEPPFVAIGFRARKTGGKYRYVWLQKVQFKNPAEKYQTKGESINFQTPEIEGTFYKTLGTGKWKADFVGLETSATAQAWYTAVKTYTPAA